MTRDNSKDIDDDFVDWLKDQLTDRTSVELRQLSETSGLTWLSQQVSQAAWRLLRDRGEIRIDLCDYFVEQDAEAERRAKFAAEQQAEPVVPPLRGRFRSLQDFSQRLG